VASALPNTLCGKLDEPGCVFGTNVLVYPNLTWEQKKKKPMLKDKFTQKFKFCLFYSPSCYSCTPPCYSCTQVQIQNTVMYTVHVIRTECGLTISSVKKDAQITINCLKTEIYIFLKKYLR